MSRRALVVALVIGAAAFVDPVAQACGDKFLLVGRGARFQRVYASVYPGNVVIYARPSTNSKAAINSPQLHKALRQAGHAVSIIQDWSLFEQALKSVRVDVVLVDVAESTKIQQAVTSSPSHPEALFVAAPSAVPPGVICKLKPNDGPVRFLDEVENVMKARTQRTKG